MDKLIFHSARQQCLITFSFDTILRRLMRFSTHVDFPQEERARERERERRDEKNSLVPLSIIERRVFGWLNLPRVRQRRTVKKGIIIREKKDLPLIPSFIPSVEKQMGHGRRRKKKNGRGKRYLAAWKQEWKWEELIEKNGSAMANDNETLM